MFHLLDDQFILDSYLKSIKLKLDEEFIILLKNEIEQRGLFDLVNQCTLSNPFPLKNILS